MSTTRYIGGVPVVRPTPAPPAPAPVVETLAVAAVVTAAADMTPQALDSGAVAEVAPASNGGLQPIAHVFQAMIVGALNGAPLVQVHFMPETMTIDQALDLERQLAVAVRALIVPGEAYYWADETSVGGGAVLLTDDNILASENLLPRDEMQAHSWVQARIRFDEESRKYAAEVVEPDGRFKELPVRWTDLNFSKWSVAQFMLKPAA